MYNSLFFYALKNIKGNILFSICYAVLFSCITTMFYSFVILGKYGNLFVKAISPSSSMILSIIFAIFLLILLSITFIIILFIFKELGRMFSTFQIFGAEKTGLLKLVVIQMFIYLIISGIFSLVLIFALYKIFYAYVSLAVAVPSLLSSLLNFIYVYLIVFVTVIFGTVIFTAIFLTKDPYDSMRGSL